MSRSLTIEDAEPQEFCTNLGWTGVINWASTLDPKTYPHICHLADHGFALDGQALQTELSDAVQQNPPRLKDVKTTLRKLGEMLAEVPDDALIVVSDGMCPDTDND